MRHDDKSLGAQSATAVATAGSVAPDAASHAETITNICGYNSHGIRISVIVPFEDGYAIPGHYASGGSAPYGGGLPLQKFSTLDNAKTYVRMMNPCQAIRWEVEEVDQFNRVRR